MLRFARRGRIAPLVLSACLVGLVFPGSAGPAEAPATRPATTTSEQVLSELSAANTARAQLLREQQEWAMDKERLSLLSESVAAEAKRLRGIAETARREEGELQKRLAGPKAQKKRLKLVEAMIDTLAERLEKALDSLAGSHLPGLVPPDRGAGITDPPRRLAAAVERLDEAERQGRKSGIEIVTGSLAGKPVTVKLLRAGAVAAWWMTLDGARAGTAAMTDGEVVLAEAASPADAEAIKKAFSMAEGHTAPDWVLLPVHQAAEK